MCDWDECKMFVMKTLKVLGESNEKIHTRISKNHTEGMEKNTEILIAIKGMKKDIYYKTGLIAVLTGGFPVVLFLAVRFVTSTF